MTSHNKTTETESSWLFNNGGKFKRVVRHRDGAVFEFIGRNQFVRLKMVRPPWYKFWKSWWVCDGEIWNAPPGWEYSVMTTEIEMEHMDRCMGYPFIERRHLRR